MGAFKSVFTQAAVYTTEAQSQNGIVYGPNGNDFTGTLVAGGGSAPPSADTTLGRIVTYRSGVAVGGVDVSIQATKTDGGLGIVDDGAPVTKTSDANGLCEFIMFKGWAYKVWEGDTKRLKEVVVPSTTGEGLDENDNFNIDSIIGVDI